MVGTSSLCSTVRNATSKSSSNQRASTVSMLVQMICGSVCVREIGASWDHEEYCCFATTSTSSSTTSTRPPRPAETYDDECCLYFFSLLVLEVFTVEN